LICGGRMAILADPLGLPGLNGRREVVTCYYRQLREMIERGLGATEAVVMTDSAADVPVGSRYLFDAGGFLVQRLADAGPAEAVTRHLLPLAQRPRPSVHQGVAYLPVLPRITLLLVGGGHVGQAVARLATDVDFDVWVLDDRERYANRDRFPSAQ